MYRLLVPLGEDPPGRLNALTVLLREAETKLYERLPVARKSLVIKRLRDVRPQFPDRLEIDATKAPGGLGGHDRRNRLARFFDAFKSQHHFVSHFCAFLQR